MHIFLLIIALCGAFMIGFGIALLVDMSFLRKR